MGKGWAVSRKSLRLRCDSAKVSLCPLRALEQRLLVEESSVGQKGSSHVTPTGFSHHLGLPGKTEWLQFKCCDRFRRCYSWKLSANYALHNWSAHFFLKGISKQWNSMATTLYSTHGVIGKWVSCYWSHLKPHPCPTTTLFQFRVTSGKAG